MQLATLKDIDVRVREYFQAALNQTMQASFDLASDGSDLQREIELYKQSHAKLQQHLARKQLPQILRFDAEDIANALAAEGMALDADRRAYLDATITKANILRDTYAMSELSGGAIPYVNPDPRFSDVVPNAFSDFQAVTPANPNLPAAKITLAAAVAEYVTQKTNGSWTKGSEKDIRRFLNFVVEVLGANTPLCDLTTAHVKRLRDLTVKLPKNAIKFSANKGKTLEALAEANSDENTISVTTQHKNFVFFKSFLKWAREEEHLKEIPGLSIKISGAAKAALKKKRLPYSAEQLKIIFASALYRGSRSRVSRHLPGKFIKRDGFYWLPLISLYSGMRLGEIVQIQTGDIRCEKDVWFFDVCRGDEESTKIVKNHAGVRKVPIHSVLLELGFLDHCKEANELGEDRIFPDLSIAADGSYSKNFSKWWGRYGTNIGVRSKLHVFHSFRHNFTDAMREADIPDAVAKALDGHADNSVHGNYGSGVSLQKLKLHIDKIAYEIDV